MNHAQVKQTSYLTMKYWLRYHRRALWILRHQNGRILCITVFIATFQTHFYINTIHKVSYDENIYFMQHPASGSHPLACSLIVWVVNRIVCPRNSLCNTKMFGKWVHLLRKFIRIIQLRSNYLKSTNKEKILLSLTYGLNLSDHNINM